MPIKTSNKYTNTIVQEDTTRPWWEKYETNAEKREREYMERNLVSFKVSDEDLKFLKQFGDINVSIAGIWLVSRMMKK